MKKEKEKLSSCHCWVTRQSKQHIVRSKFPGGKCACLPTHALQLLQVPSIGAVSQKTILPMPIWRQKKCIHKFDRQWLRGKWHATPIYMHSWTRYKPFEFKFTTHSPYWFNADPTVLEKNRKGISRSYLDYTQALQGGNKNFLFALSTINICEPPSFDNCACWTPWKAVLSTSQHFIYIFNLAITTCGAPPPDGFHHCFWNFKQIFTKFLLLQELPVAEVLH